MWSKTSGQNLPMNRRCALEMVHLLTPAGAALWRTSWCAGSSASVTELGIIDPRKLPDLLLLLRKRIRYDHFCKSCIWLTNVKQKDKKNTDRCTAWTRRILENIYILQAFTSSKFKAGKENTLISIYRYKDFPLVNFCWKNMITN